MTPRREALADYLALRRALGYQLVRPEKLLNQFLTYLEDVGADTVTVKAAVDWARLPAGGDTNWWAHRLSVVRGFAIYLHTLDPATEVPAADMLPYRPRRATPYLYSDDDITALTAATASLRTPLRRATYATQIGLLSVTGMRVSEAIALERTDVDLVAGRLLVRNAKFGKTRELVLHSPTIGALARYLRLRGPDGSLMPIATLRSISSSLRALLSANRSTALASITVRRDTCWPQHASMAQHRRSFTGRAASLPWAQHWHFSHSRLSHPRTSRTVSLSSRFSPRPGATCKRTCMAQVSAVLGLSDVLTT